MKFFVVVVFASFISFASGGPTSCKQVDPSDRADCGYYGITRHECVDKGCCFDNTTPESIWCYVDPDRNPCSSSPCQNGGRCVPYDPRNFDCYCTEEFTGTTCQIGTASSCRNVAAGDRVDCGYQGVTAEDCIANTDCCFDNSIPRVPWCFKKPTIPKRLTPCQLAAKQAQPPPGRMIVGRYVPQCDADGNYEPVQYHPSTGYSWCVDKDGVEIPGTRLPPGKPRTSCESGCASQPCENGGTCTDNGGGSFTCQCPEFLMGDTCNIAYDPLCMMMPCKNGGSCLKVGVHDYQCVCLDGFYGDLCENGPPETTPLPPTTEYPSDLTPCQLAAAKAQMPEGFVGNYVPQCDADGNYEPQQCWGSTGYCWCVDQDGVEIPGTKTPPGSPSPNCACFLDIVPGPCKGSFTRFAFDQTTGQCEMFVYGGCGGNANRFATSDECQGNCSQGENVIITTPEPADLTPCQLAAAKAQMPEGFVGNYVPQCDADGNYEPLQCWGSTGYCWCVDQDGVEIPGTKTPPGNTPPNCACFLDIEPGPCKAYFPLYAFDQATGQCEMFVYGGCQGNANRFATFAECVGNCSQGENVITTTPEPSYVCDGDHPCQNGGTCVDNRIYGGGFVCECPSNAEGPACENLAPPTCNDKPCQNGGTCIDNGPEGFTCKCPSYTAGDVCEYLGDWLCMLEGCRNGGSCQDVGEKYACVCPDGFSGELCEEATVTIDPSSLTPCQLAAQQAGEPMPGRYIPQCDADGNYEPLQIYGSTGYSWCVDQNGVEIPGTRTPPGQPSPNCGPDNPVQVTEDVPIES